MDTAPHILLSGASGLIGRALIRSFADRGIPCTQLVRSATPSSATTICWNPYGLDGTLVSPADISRLEGCSTAIHLSGDNLSEGRWTPEKKRRMWESRITTTHAMATLLSRLQSPPKLFICASAIGYYGDRGDQPITETSLAGRGYLPEMCVAWEQAANPARQYGMRVVPLRLGVVLAPTAGALATVLPLFRWGLGGRLGNGHQWMSWISLPDVVRIVEHIQSNTQILEAVNTVSPQPVTNAAFAQILGEALHRPALLSMPAFVLRAMFGEMADKVLLSSIRALPATLLQSGFIFQHAALAAALHAQLHPDPPALLG